MDDYLDCTPAPGGVEWRDECWGPVIEASASVEQGGGCACAPGGCRPGSCACMRQGQLFDEQGRLLPLVHGFKELDTLHECGSTCGCGARCSNARTVRWRGRRLQLRKVAGKGWGVVALERIPVGTLLGLYAGEYIATDEAQRRLREYDAEGRGHALLVSRAAPRRAACTEYDAEGREGLHSQPGASTLAALPLRRSSASGCQGGRPACGPTLTRHAAAISCAFSTTPATAATWHRHARLALRPRACKKQHWPAALSGWHKMACWRPVPGPGLGAARRPPGALCCLLCGGRHSRGGGALLLLRPTQPGARQALPLWHRCLPGLPAARGGVRRRAAPRRGVAHPVAGPASALRTCQAERAVGGLLAAWAFCSSPGPDRTRAAAPRRAVRAALRRTTPELRPSGNLQHARASLTIIVAVGQAARQGRPGCAREPGRLGAPRHPPGAAEAGRRAG